MGVLALSYRLAYISKGVATGLSDVQVHILKPDSTVVGPFFMSEMPSPFTGRYFYDFQTTANDPQGEYFARIFSPSEAINDTHRFSLYQSPEVVLASSIAQLSASAVKVTNAANLIAVSTT